MEMGRLLATARPGRSGAPEGVGGLPLTVREVIGRRLERLAPVCQRALTVAAVIGREFDVAILAPTLEAQAAARDEALWTVLEEAARAQVIEGLPGDLGRFRFRHALIRETLYDDLPLTQRVRLHRQVGEAVAAVHAAHIDDYLADLAWHFTAAAPAGGAEQAVAYAERAAVRAMRQDTSQIDGLHGRAVALTNDPL